MNKIKSVVCIFLTIISILIVYLNGVFFAPWVDGRKLYIKDFVNVTPFILILLPIVFLIRYIWMLKKKNKYFDTKKLNNIIMIFSFSIFAVGLVDVLRYYFFSSKILDVYLPTFMFQYMGLIEIIYLILFFWIGFLNKTKIKRSMLDKFKIANSMLTIILWVICGMTAISNDIGIFMNNCLFLMLLQAFFLLRKNKQLILTNLYNIFVVFCNITLIVFIILNDFELGFVAQLLIGLLPFVTSLIIIFNIRKKILKILMGLVAVGVYAFCMLILINEYIIEPMQEKKQLQQQIAKLNKEQEQMVIDLKKGNEYSKKENYENLKLNYNLTINNKQEMNNLLYTFYDSSMKKIVINCSKEYKKCEDDFRSVFQNLKNEAIYNTASAYNRPKNIRASSSYDGRMIVKKENYYSKKQVSEINEKVDQIYKQYYDKNKSAEENIKVFHDYLINNTEYIAEQNVNNIYSVFIEGKGALYGYTEAMGVLLDKMGIKNIKVVSSEKENKGYYVSNLVFVNGEWKHLNVATDDKITQANNGKISYSYFLIDTKTLNSYNQNKFQFDSEIYKGFIN